MAIYHSITGFRPYVFGTHFTVRSDHKPLVYLYNMKNPASKLVRIRFELEEYAFDIEYIPGKQNVAADALSRLTFDDIKEMSENSKNIFVTTRSMSKNKNDANINQNTNQNNINDNDKNEPTSAIYEKLSGFDKKFPKIKTFIENKKLCAFQNHNKIFEIDISAEIANERYDLSGILSKLNGAAIKYKIKEIQWPQNDELFTKIKLESFKTICEQNLKNLKIALVTIPNIITDNNEKQKLLKLYHDDPILGGHCGQKRLYAKLRANFYWKNMSKDVATYVKNCQACMLNKPKNKTKETMKITNTPQKPFDEVIIDTIGPLCKSASGNVYAVTIICDLTKYIVSIPIPNKEATTIARAIFNNFVLVYGPMKSIRTDRGTEYCNEGIKEFCNMLKVQHNISTAYHHETLGTIERNHRVFNEYLRIYGYDDNWDIHLQYFTFCYNISYNTSLNHEYTPFELVFAKKCTIADDLLNKIEPIYDFENFVKIAKNTLAKAHKHARELLEKSKLKNKMYYDKLANPISININDKVLLAKEPYDKRHAIFEGPFRVKEIKDKNVVLDYKGKTIEVHKNRLVKP